jgi:hypothetical protein
MKANAISALADMDEGWQSLEWKLATKIDVAVRVFLVTFFDVFVSDLL